MASHMPDESSQSRAADAGHDFPHAGSLCEACGYPLTGLKPTGDCPECGQPIEASHPKHRPGLPWQQHRGVTSFISTSVAIAFQPRQSFRQMQVGGDNGRDRAFLLWFAGLAGVVWAGIGYVGGLTHPPLWGIAVVSAIVLMTYIEVLGVLYAGKHRGWRASWHVSERVCCYSGVGWLPAAIIGVKAAILDQHQMLADWWPAALGAWSNWHRFFVLVAIACIGMLGFETLVWIGIDRTRFANSPAGKPPDNADSPPAQ